MMNDLFSTVLAIHICFGGVALGVAPLAMITIKGGLWHRRWGKLYFWSMAGVAATAALLCWLRSGLFLFLIALFSFYLALTGYRVLWRKRPADGPSTLDWCAAAAMLLAGGWLIVLGFRDAGSGQWIRIIFGMIGVLLGGTDVWQFLRRPTDKWAWMYAHMTRFLSAYIATVTAFSVVTFTFLPFLWRWLWPTVLGSVGITVWRIYYAKKFGLQTSLNTEPKAADTAISVSRRQ